LAIAADQCLVQVELASGDSKVHPASIARPESIPPPMLATAAGIRARCALWRTEQGLFLAQGDGPRGWVEPLALFSSDESVFPTESGAALLRLTPEPTLVGTVPFEGKLRASRVLDDCVILINEKGKVFSAKK
jgi:hypothetical protein